MKVTISQLHICYIPKRDGSGQLEMSSHTALSIICLKRDGAGQLEMLCWKSHPL